MGRWLPIVGGAKVDIGDLLEHLENLFTPNTQKLKTRGDIEAIIKILRKRGKRTRYRNYKIASGLWVSRNVRVEAARALGEIGDKRAFDALLRCLEDEDDDRAVREAAAIALAHLEDVRAIRPILNWVDSVRSYAVIAGYEYIPETLTSSFWQIGKPAVQPLIQELAQGDHGDLATRIIMNALGAIGASDVVEPLIAYFRRYNDANAARALGQLRDARAVQPLIDALKSSYSNVRAEAAAALGRIGDKRAIKPLEMALSEEFNRAIWKIKDAMESSLAKLRKRYGESIR